MALMRRPAAEVAEEVLPDAPSFVGDDQGAFHDRHRERGPVQRLGLIQGIPVPLAVAAPRADSRPGPARPDAGKELIAVDIGQCEGHDLRPRRASGRLWEYQRLLLAGILQVPERDPVLRSGDHGVSIQEEERDGISLLVNERWRRRRDRLGPEAAVALPAPDLQLPTPPRRD